MNCDLLWFGSRGGDARMLGNPRVLVGVVCCDWSDALRELSRRVPVLSLERNLRLRKRWDSSSLCQMLTAEVASFLEGLSRKRPIVVVPYRAIPDLEALVSPRIRVVAPPAQLVAVLDDKIRQRRLFAAWGMPSPNSVAIETAGEGLAGVAVPEDMLVSGPVVVQRPIGSLGIGTELHTRPGMLALPAGERLLASPFVAGPVINATAVVHGGAVIVSWPSVQLTGFTACGAGDERFLYCGNDFGAVSALPQNARSALFELMRRLGKNLGRLGWIGIFGADWVFDGGRWLLLEVNPRCQGSTAILVDLERRSGRKTTMQAHLAAFEAGPSFTALADPKPLTGARVVLYFRGDVRSVHPIRSVAAPEGLPVRGTPIEDGACLGEVRFGKRVLDDGLENFTPEVDATVRGMRTVASNRAAMLAGACHGA